MLTSLFKLHTVCCILYQNILIFLKGILWQKHLEVFKANPENKEMQSSRRFLFQLFLLFFLMIYDFIMNSIQGYLPESNIQKQTTNQAGLG